MTTNHYLLRFVQQHPKFRVAELESCAILSNTSVKQPLQFTEYDDLEPFAVLELENEVNAVAIIQRSILTQYSLA